MELIGEWSDEKKAFVLYNVTHTNFGRSVLNKVMTRIINNDTDICVCSTCMLEAYCEFGNDVGITVVKHWAIEYDLQG